MSTSIVDEYGDELNEGSRRIRRGCTIGRILNLCIALDFLLVMITALIVSGVLGAVNLALQESYKDDPKGSVPVKHRVCILYSTCDGDTSYSACLFHYNTTGVCNYVEVAFGFIALVALIYIIISIVRAVLTTNISLTVFVDLGVIILCVLVAFTTGVAVSIGLSLTCKAVSSRYTDTKTCDRGIPNIPAPTPAPTSSSSVGEDRDEGYYFYNSVNVVQSSAWLCFAFLMILLIMTVVRVVIYFTRRRVASQENNVEDITDVLTRTNDDDDEEEEAKPI